MTARHVLSGERGGGAPPLRSLHPAGSVGTGEAIVPSGLAGLETWAPPVVQVAALVLLAGVGILDRANGPDLHFTAFYLLPVALVSWRLGRDMGIVWSIATAAVWLLVALTGDPLPRPVVYWNALVTTLIFLTVALILSETRALWESARKLARSDSLTGVLNGAAFQELVELERTRSVRYDRPFTLAYLDVDDFNALNEHRGHTLGDRVLQLVAVTIQDNIRSMDAVARLGGDEFAVLLPETGRGAAEVALDKIRSQLEAAMREASLPLTISMGAVICVGAPDSVDRLIRRADTLVTAVKRRGGADLVVEVLDDSFGIEAILRRG